MNQDILTLQELEQLSLAYMNCRLSRLQEKELELVLLNSELSSPLIDEVRLTMGLSWSMAELNSSKTGFKRRLKTKFFIYAGIAAAIAVVVFCTAIYINTPSSNNLPEIYACVDGKVLSGHVAQAIISETEEESMEMLRAVIEDAENEQHISSKYLNSISE